MKIVLLEMSASNSKKGNQKKSVEQTYVKKSQIEHILDLPDTYIGSIEHTQLETWTLDDDDSRMVYKQVDYIPGLYKIFDEILVNAIDQYVRTENDVNIVNKVTQIKVEINRDENILSVMNNGEGIPIVHHSEYGVYVPELIFGHLLTSSNYDKEEKKITGGKNGIGSKACSIFSKYFKIETVDVSRKLKYTQTFQNNMSVINPPEIVKFTGKPYTKVEFSPDLQRFGLSRLDEGTVQLMKKRVFDATVCTNKTVSVFLNEKKIECKTLEKYVNFYLGEMTERVYDLNEENDRWEVVVAVNPEPRFDQVSFVNGVSTLKGGKHVDAVANAITKAITTIASTKGIKRKKVDIKPNDLKNNMFVFVRSTIENPSFDSQTKEYMTTPATKFGSKYEPSEKFIEKLMKTTLIERAMRLTEFKDTLGLQKTSGTKSTRISGIPKLDDANKAGTDESHKCTLILTEGDSAKALAISGLSVVGRNYFGVFPLRGKLMNVRNMEKKRVATNEEISNLVKILGLKYSDKKKTKEETFRELRYGRVMLFTDSDVDGSHIKGLVMNLFSYFWPELLEIPGFIIALATPIVKVRRMKEVHSFYTLTEYEQWKESVDNVKNWEVKYYKGLGTSTDKEAKEYFENFEMKKIEYVMSDLLEDGNLDEEQRTISIDRLELAFQKTREDDRKAWLKSYDRSEILEQTQKKIYYSEFVDRDLKHFSNYDNQRSIPSMCDGLKPSLRKILFACLKRNLKKDIRVSQLAGYISEKTNYHHGEASLYEGIVGMAQNFVGSNNLEVLVPSGQFGCFDPNTDILMWDGSIKKASNILVGDKLVGDDGTVRNVIQLVNGTDDMYRVKDTDDKEMIVNSKHILTMYVEYNLEINWKENNKRWIMKYFDGKTVKNISISINDDINNDNHFNRSKITKAEGFEMINDMRNKIISTYGDSKIVDIEISDYMNLSSYDKRGFYQINNMNCIQWENKPVPIEPYIFGAWLGDGDHAGKGFTTEDIEMVQSYVRWGKTMNIEITHHVSKNHDGYHYCIRRKGTGFLNSVGSNTHSTSSCVGCLSSNVPINPNICNWLCDCDESINEENKDLLDYCDNKKLNPFTEILRRNDLFKNKHIPDVYIYNDKDTRLKLLAGFIDTDGTIRNNNTHNVSIEISQCKRSHSGLIYSLEFICKSLGFSTSIYESRNNEMTKKNEPTTILTLKIWGDNLDEIPTRIERKKIIYSGSRNRKNRHFTKITIEHIGQGQYNGWQIDGNERFLLGNFIVAHNCRIGGGQDHASPRYIFTRLRDYTSLIYNMKDAPLLEYVDDDDGNKVEPVHYVPIIPMLLVNGSVGIGTGFSTLVPQHNPLLVIRNLIHLMDGEEIEKMEPWFRGFTGEVLYKGTTDSGYEQYMNKGIYEVIDESTLRILELPIGRWTSKYKEFLETMMADKDEDGRPNKYVISNIMDNSTDKTVDFTLKFKKGLVREMMERNEIEEVMRLTESKNSNYSNMHLYNSRGVITKYDSVEDILKEFYVIRLGFYMKRKEYLLRDMRKELDIYEAKIRFITEFINGDIEIMQKEDEEILNQLETRGYPKFASGNVKKTTKKNDISDDVEDIEGEEEVVKVVEDMNYNYLLHMRIQSLTKKKIEELRRLHENKLAEFQELDSKTEKDLWKDDLYELKGMIERDYRQYEEDLESDRKTEKKDKKKGNKKMFTITPAKTVSPVKTYGMNESMTASNSRIEQMIAKAKSKPIPKRTVKKKSD